MNQTILLVDQKPNTAALVSTYLRADGFSVDHTPDPSEALKFASHMKYRVVITDLVMRGMTGLDLYREIRSYNGEVRFMFLLSVSSDEAIRLMGSLDRDDVIKKEPLSINEVMYKVRAALTNSR
ncbi:MAG: response regulator [Nitrososphaera sp.]|uniref:Putative signal transduction response regulator, receiver domain protein n=1 Tax=Nitrososphaera gargensis (strain Ga9.2) TaxID=1237085 RepID=K0IBL5_NITGG|nr:response regulator [Candidatus Nitrososphaera gargensis]AFU56955.1 putative signal transduction response regulator, receiver domain protein [Candidatus Nitrososphaera gargensis Ga9.2]